jgi:hypothetical protein
MTYLIKEDVSETMLTRRSIDQTWQQRQYRVLTDLNATSLTDLPNPTTASGSLPAPRSRPREPITAPARRRTRRERVSLSLRHSLGPFAHLLMQDLQINGATTTISRTQALSESFSHFRMCSWSPPTHSRRHNPGPDGCTHNPPPTFSLRTQPLLLTPLLGVALLLRSFSQVGSLFDYPRIAQVVASVC